MDITSNGKVDEEYVKLRAALVGDSGVGKTAVLVMYTENKFVAALSSTVGIDWREKRIEVDGKKVKLQIWDTAGQERFSITVPVLFRRADIILLLYDISNMASFHSISDWIDKLPLKEETPVVLIGNKSDLEEKREVPTKMGESKASELLPGGVPFFETSAKDNQNIDLVFHQVVSNLLAKKSQESKRSPSEIRRLSENTQERKGCCT